MPPPLPPHLWLWLGLQLLYLYWWLVTPPVLCLTCWHGFHFLPGGALSEVIQSVALSRTHSEMWKRRPPCSFSAYKTWQFLWFFWPGPYCCPGWFHLVLLSVLFRNLGGLPLQGTWTQSWMRTIWGQQGPVTHQLPSSMEKVWHTLLMYIMTIHMHIKIPYFWACGLTSSHWEHFRVFSSPLLLLPFYVHRHFFLRNFGQWIACTSVLAWDLTLVDYLFLSSTLLSKLPLSSVLFYVSGIVTINETVIPYDFLVASLYFCGNIISSLNFSPRCPLTETLFSVIIEAFIVCKNGHENMVLHSVSSTMDK